MNLPLGSQWISGFELEDSSFTPGWLEGLNRTCSNHEDPTRSERRRRRKFHDSWRFRAFTSNGQM
jgi:hypothetical protein